MILSFYVLDWLFLTKEFKWARLFILMWLKNTYFFKFLQALRVGDVLTLLAPITTHREPWHAQNVFSHGKKRKPILIKVSLVYLTRWLLHFFLLNFKSFPLYSTRPFFKQQKQRLSSVKWFRFVFNILKIVKF